MHASNDSDRSDRGTTWPAESSTADRQGTEDYVAPKVVILGSVADLTRQGEPGDSGFVPF